MKNSKTLWIVFLTALATGVANYAHAATDTWANAGTDFNTSANWNAGLGPVPGAGDTALFSGTASAQPNLSASDTITQISFSSSAYDLTNTNSAVLTLSGTGNGASSAVYGSNTSGTNTISAPLTFSMADTGSGDTQNINQVSGGTLDISTISGTVGAASGALLLSSGSSGGITIGSVTINNAGPGAGTGAIQNSAGNNTITALSLVGSSRIGANAGTLTITNGITSTAQALRVLGNGTLVLGGNDTGVSSLLLGLTGTSYSPVIEVGDNGALGTGAVTFSANSAATIQSSSATSYTFANALTVSASATSETFGASGTGSLQFNGAVTLAGAFNAAVNNASTTFSNTISGTGMAVTKSGTGAMILTGTNSYSGATTVSTGSLLFGTGGSSNDTSSVSVAAGATLGTVQGNASRMTLFNAPSLALNMGSAGTQSNLQLNLYAGAASDTIDVGALSLSGTGTVLVTLDDTTGNDNLTGPYTLMTWASGTATTSDFSLAGNASNEGTLSVVGNSLEFSTVPEPSTWAMMMGGLAFVAFWQRSRKQSN